MLVPVELDVEVLAANQFGVGGLLVSVEGGTYDAINNDELIDWRIEFCRSHLDQHAACFRRRHAHLLAAVQDAGGTGGAALVHAVGGVTHVDFDGLERDVEFFRNHLADGDEQAVAHVHLAEVGRDGAVGVDRDVGRKLVRRQRRLGSALRERGIDAEQCVEAHRCTDRYDECATGLEKGAAGERGGFFLLGHGVLPQPIIVAARLTAFMMLTCVPQRHLSPSSAPLISASVGFFLVARKAAAVMIQPLMQ